DRPQAADARTDHDPGAVLVLVALGLPAGVGQGLVGRRDGVQDEVVDPLTVLGRHHLLGVEHPRLAGRPAAAAVDRRDLAGDGAGIALGIETGDRADARTAGENRLPDMLHTPP